MWEGDRGGKGKLIGLCYRSNVCISPDSCVECLTSSVALFGIRKRLKSQGVRHDLGTEQQQRLNEVIRVEPWPNRISVFIRRELLLPDPSMCLYQGKAMWGHREKGLVRNTGREILGPLDLDLRLSSLQNFKKTNFYCLSYILLW